MEHNGDKTLCKMGYGAPTTMVDTWHILLYGDILTF